MATQAAPQDDAAAAVHMKAGGPLGGYGEGSALDMDKSFPLFQGEGGVIESNKIYVHPNAAARGAWAIGKKVRSLTETLLANAALNTKLSSMEGIASKRADASQSREMPPVVADALRSGFVGPRYKQITANGTIPGGHPLEGKGPSVIELEGLVYIVEK